MDTDPAKPQPVPEPAAAAIEIPAQSKPPEAPKLVKPVEPAPKKANGKVIWATGRRKTSIAQVRMAPTKEGGKILVNGQSVEAYFRGNKRQALAALQSFNAAKSVGGYDFHIKVLGGGITGQADAIRHGLARALSKWDEKIRLLMRKEGYLTRDPRAVERKKSGQPKARKRFQYSKR